MRLSSRRHQRAPRSYKERCTVGSAQTYVVFQHGLEAADRATTGAGALARIYTDR
jgi:hypothetical protein